MCGICGIFSRGSIDPVPDRVRAMRERMRHRGPDDQGEFFGPGIGFGFDRLAILDLTPTGHQPMVTDDGRFALIFNGEIYNFQALRERLEETGVRFRGRADSEVILRGFERWGEDLFPLLNGMFAIAIWDAERRRLTLARDRMGKKPLFYRDSGGEVVFASELQALLAALPSTPEVDPEALDLFLAYACVPGERSIFAGVRKLPPAHVATFDANGSAARRYWELSFRDKTDRGEEELLAELDALVSDATRIRMIADVPLGAFLSGGVDSSVIVAHMSRLASGVRTFAIGFPEERFNELPHAAAVARHCGTIHEELIVEPDAAEILPRLVWHYGEPFGDASAVPTYYVARAARRHVTVALNGDGGDESFAGYDWCRSEATLQRYREALPAALRRGPLRSLGPIAARLPGRAGRQLSALLSRGAQTVAEAYWHWDPWGEAERSRLYRPDWRRRLATFRSRAHLEGIFARGTAHEDLDRALEAMIHLYLPDDLLVKADIASMANSLEPRSPLLDHRIVEFAARLPTSLKVNGGLTKALLKRHAAALVPPGVVYRPKQGFALPVADWLRGALRPALEGVLLHPRSLERGYFQPDAVRSLVGEFLGGTGTGTRLWGLLWLELWHLLFIDGTIAPDDSLRQV